VGKKPPQSQKGGSHGLTPRNSTGLSPKEDGILFLFLYYYFILFYFIFGFPPRHRRHRGAPQGRLQTKKKFKNLKKF
jgi:hypothetical protein